MNNWERLRKPLTDRNPEPEPAKPRKPRGPKQRTHALPIYTQTDRLGHEAEVYPLDEFIVLSGHYLLVDKDGEGFLGTSYARTSDRIRCEDAGRKPVPPPCDHVWWYPTKPDEDTRTRKDEAGLSAYVYTRDEFETMCAHGEITGEGDRSGVGFLGTATSRDPRYDVDFNERYFRGVRPEFTHVWWYPLED